MRANTLSIRLNLTVAGNVVMIDVVDSTRTLQPILPLLTRYSPGAACRMTTAPAKSKANKPFAGVAAAWSQTAEPIRGTVSRRETVRSRAHRLHRLIAMPASMAG